MDSVDFFTTMAGVFKNANEAFGQALENGSFKSVSADSDKPVIGKEVFVQLGVPKDADPMVFAKEQAAWHGNNFWNFVDGPVACVEIKGDWLKKYLPEGSEYSKGFKMFVFFGCGYRKK